MHEYPAHCSPPPVPASHCFGSSKQGPNATIVCGSRPTTWAAATAAAAPAPAAAGAQAATTWRLLLLPRPCDPAVAAAATLCGHCSCCHSPRRCAQCRSHCRRQPVPVAAGGPPLVAALPYLIFYLRVLNTFHHQTGSHGRGGAAARTLRAGAVGRRCCGKRRD